MNRQETVIAIAKINRLVKTLYYKIDMDMDLCITDFEDDISEIAKDTEHVLAYLKKNPIKILAELIQKMGTMESVDEYINQRNGTIDARIRSSLVLLSKNMSELQDYCRKIVSKDDPKYPGLVRALANNKAVRLLRRAVDAKLLNEQFMPEETTSSAQLRVIAFAVGTLLEIPRNQLYVHFEKQWSRANYRLSTTPLPAKRGYEKHQYAMSLYPEVNFEAMSLPSKEIDTFYTDRDQNHIKRLYEDLISHGYIGHYTSFEELEGIFDAKRYIRPIEWIQEQRLLGYFVQIAFSKLNTRNIWNKTVCCFSIFGQEPHKGSMCSGFNYIVRKNLLDTYNCELKEIAERFNKD